MLIGMDGRVIYFENWVHPAALELIAHTPNASWRPTALCAASTICDANR